MILQMQNNLSRMKELCLLHHRDETIAKSRELNEIIKARDNITWRDLQTILQTNEVSWDLIENFYKYGRLTTEKFEFVKDSLKFIEQRESEDPHGPFIYAHQSIYDVVWKFTSLHNPKTIFRGQYNAHWPMESSLLRIDKGSARLNIKTLINRLELTNSFLHELNSEEMKIFGKKFDDKSLLAIAQHFGFPTPLLDFTRSFKTAAFFATQAAKKKIDHNPECGVIYYMNTDITNKIRNPGFKIGIDLLSLLDIRIGDIEIIEPDIPAEDDRINRQKGVFIAGYQTNDLHNFTVDRILFWQHPGVVFEDTKLGIDESRLLPDKTPLTNIAQQVRDSFRSKSVENILGNIEFAQPSIIGSQGTLLRSQLKEAEVFLSCLNDTLGHFCYEKDLFILREIILNYFNAINIEKYVGELPKGGFSENADRPLFTLSQELASWSKINLNDLWQYLNSLLDGAPAEIDLGKLSEVPLPKFDTPKGKISLAIGVYLTSWEHLRYVDGTKARRLASQASILLKEIA
jgi:hypothetical protein